MNENEMNAATVKAALENFSNHPERIENFISYLENCFSVWYGKYAGTPAGLADELKHFSEIELNY